MKNQIYFSGLPAAWKESAQSLLFDLGIGLSKEGTKVTVTSGDGLDICRTEDGIRLAVKRQQDFSRALSYLPAFLSGRKTAVFEKCNANTLCLMADCSRNAVLSMDGAKKMIRDLAVMGFDSLMLYTEDTYELPDYPYFGRQRGRYTVSELKELDDYAFSFGIELIPCIQTLGHLERALQWKAFDGMKDTDDILLVGEEKTYALIDEMLRVYASAFRSRRVNIGMDETHTLGRGKYMDLHGSRKTSDIMLEHLGRVNELCRKNGFAPMMWSDMFFRMAFNGRYYISEGEISKEVMDKVPEGVTLIYWDYYTSESQRERFSHMLDCHRKFPHNKTAFAGGAWCWAGFTPHARFSVNSTRIQLEECRKRGMKDFIVTAWGDNGRETSLYTTLTTLLLYAEYAYTGELPDNARLESRCRDTFGIGFEELLTLDAPDAMAHRGDTELVHPRNPSKYLFFNDPLEGLRDAHMDPENVSADFADAEKQLRKYENHPRFGYLYRSLADLCHVLIRKADFTVRLRGAYLAGDRDRIAVIADEVPLIISDIERFLESFRTQWKKENKPAGFLVQELRIGGLIQRMKGAELRIREYLAGEADAIPELEEPVLPFNGKNETSPYTTNEDFVMKGDSTPYFYDNIWHRIVTSCIL